MSPKKITRFALILAAVSLVGIVPMLVLRPGWGVLDWWPVLGLGLALLGLGLAFLRGAYLAAQKRVYMADLLNDCYAGVPENQGAARR